jgi:hypothetical protein
VRLGVLSLIGTAQFSLALDHGVTITAWGDDEADALENLASEMADEMRRLIAWRAFSAAHGLALSDEDTIVRFNEWWAREVPE